MPALLVGTLSTWAALAGWATYAQAEFRIGVWQPGGLTGADILFTSDTVDDLDALGVDLLINTPGVSTNSNMTQDFEESIMSQWSGMGPQGSRGFVVTKAPEGHSMRGYRWYLERYAGALLSNAHCGMHGVAEPMMPTERIHLEEAVRLLESKWSAYAGFYGYRIGHEADPCGNGGGSTIRRHMSTWSQ